MSNHKFNPKNIHLLDDPKRLKILDIRRVIEHFELKENSVLVDIGTGAGLFAEAFLDILPGSICYALDIEQEMVDWIRNHRRTYKEGRLTPLLMEETQTPLDSEIADFIFMITVYHELNDPIALVRECKRILKLSGKIFIADWTMEAPDGPPKDHRIEPSLVFSHLGLAGFKDISTFSASESLFCIGAVKGASNSSLFSMHMRN